MKKFSKSLASLFLCMTLFGSASFPLPFGGTVYATENQDFKDVNTTYWGAPYIDFAASVSIINGYPQADGTFRFKPENPVSKEEAMQMLYKTVKNAKLATVPEGTLSAGYEEILTSAGIPSWAWECVSYGLKCGILETPELGNFRSDSGKANTATREEVARWAAKAVGGVLLPAVSFEFSDAAKIKEANLYYVDYLTRMGVMIGDNKNNFNPAANITRVEYAVICKRLYAFADTKYDLNKESRSYQGVVTKIDKNTKTLYLSEAGGKTRAIKFAGSAEIFKDGKAATLDSLTIGSNAIVAWGPFDQVYVVTAVAAGTGEVSEIKERSADCSEIVIKDSEGSLLHYFITDEGTRTVGDPTDGDSVRFLADGVKLIELVVE